MGENLSNLLASQTASVKTVLYEGGEITIEL
jgi:hypothetical protein